MDAGNYGLKVVREAIRRAVLRVGSDGGEVMVPKGHVAEVELLLQGEPIYARGIAHITQEEVITFARTLVDEGGWEMVEEIINPAFVVSARPALIPWE